MANYGVENGVHIDDIILEENSVTLPDNVKRTIDLLEMMRWHPRSLTIVATDFVLTRARFEWYKFCPWDIAITPIAARPQSPYLNTKNWSKDETAIALVLNEYAKIIIESKMDLIKREN